MKEDKRSVQATVPREGAPARGVSRPMVRAAQQQCAVCVLDTSSSMAGAKIEEVNAALVALVDELADPKNRGAFFIEVVKYANDASVHLARTAAADARREDYTIPSNAVGGFTSISAGLSVASDLVDGSLRAEGEWMRPVVLLLTDGQHNRGADPLSVATPLKKKADILAVAFGADADLARLSALATSPQHALRCASGADLRKFFATVGRTMSQAARGGGQSVAALLGGNSVLRG